MSTVTVGPASGAARAVLALEGVGVRFDLDRQGRPVTPGLAWVRRRRRAVWGLRGLDLAVEPGGGLAVVGATGSGKTTLLRVLAGVLRPDEGSVAVSGRVGSLLATEAGLIGQLTGRENAILLGVLAGLSLAETRAGLEGLRDRSRLGEAFDRQVSGYSEGMRARLGFAVATSAQPGVLLLDEVFEALDHEFRAIVEAYARGLRERGGIVVAAGHDHAALARICDRAVWMQDGAVRASGPFAEVVEAYRA